MPLSQRIDAAVLRALDMTQGQEAPAQLSEALGYACLPGGARIRPTILMSVAMACGDDRPALSDAAAAALEVIHCASLVHDDLPCFDDAELRRGKPSVHKAYSQPLAVLTGDSLIILAFDILARAAEEDPVRGLRLIRALATRTGMPGGSAPGKAGKASGKWTLWPIIARRRQHFSSRRRRWARFRRGMMRSLGATFGALIGEAFQVADDLRDAVLDEKTLGKPVGQDDLHGRPNAVAEYGVEGAVARLKDILAGAIASIPSCPGEAALAEMVRLQAQAIMPKMPAGYRV